MDIDRLSASVDVDSSAANASLDRLDRKADEAAENRAGVIKISVDDSDLGRFVSGRGNNRGLGNGINLPDLIPGEGRGRGDRDGFLPDFGEMLPDVNALTGAFENLADTATAGATSVAALGTEVTGAAGSATKLGSSVASAIPSMITITLKIGLVLAVLGLVFLLITALIPLVIGLGVAIVALGGYVLGLLAALAPLVGVIFVLAPLLVALGAAIAVVATALVTLLPAIQEVWAAEGELEARTIQLANSQNALAQAEHTRARAARAYANARRDATEAIEDAQFAAEGAQLSEERAIIALERAYKRLADVQANVAGKTTEISKVTDDFTGKQFEVARVTYSAATAQEEIRDALLSVRDAELGLARAQDHREDTAIALLDIESRGIENSDILTQSRLNLTAATAALAAANRGVAESQGALDGQGEKYDALGASGKSLVDTIALLRPIFSEISNTIQEELFPGLQRGIENALPFIEDMQGHLGPLAAEMGTVAENFGKLFGSETFRDDINTFFEDNAGNMEKLGDAAIDFTSGFASLLVAAQPLTQWMVDGAGRAGENFKMWAEGDSEMGDLTKWFELTADVLDLVFGILGNLITGMTGFVEAATPFGTWVLEGLLGASEAFSEFTNSAEGQEKIAGFFERIKEPLEALSSLGGGILAGFVSIFGSQEAMDFLTNFTDFLTEDFGPMFGDLMKDFIESGTLDKIIDFFREMVDFTVALDEAGFFDDLATNFGRAMVLGQNLFRNLQDLVGPITAISNFLGFILTVPGLLSVDEPTWDKFKVVLEKISGFLGSIVSFFGDLFEFDVGTFFEPFDPFRQTLDLIVSAASTLYDIFSNIFGLGDFMPSLPSIPDALNPFSGGGDLTGSFVPGPTPGDTEGNRTADIFNDTVGKTLDIVKTDIENAIDRGIVMKIVDDRGVSTRPRGALFTGGEFKGLALVGENGPELLSSNRTMSVFNNADTRSFARGLGNGGGSGDIEAIIMRIIEAVRPDVKIEQNFSGDPDPKAIGSEVAWAMAS